MSTKLAVAGNEDWGMIRSQANDLVRSGFLPKSINTPEKALAIMQTGRELGIGPMQALRSIHIIEGKPTMSAELIAGLVMSRIPGSCLRVSVTNNKECVVIASRPGQDTTEFRFTIDDAKTAGLLGKHNWKTYPRAMLRSRCVTEAARATFPDATMGIYDPDELGAITSPTGEVMSVASEMVPEEVPESEFKSVLSIIGSAESQDELAKLMAPQKNKQWSAKQRSELRALVKEMRGSFSVEPMREPGEEG